MPGAAFVVWGPELSPFLLKLESLLAYKGFAWRRLPRDGTRLENLRTAVRVNMAVRRRTAVRPPANDPLDEYPLVPFLLTPEGDVLYDTTALAHWLDEREPDRRLVPDDEATSFVASLIDEAFDEFGLYMVHHNRWKLAAADNDSPGVRLAREYARFLPPGSGALFARWFAARQVRRLPYLFSVAPDGYRVDGLPPALTPPSRAGFPPTHELLERSWERYVTAIEEILAVQPFLLGEAFTIADASAYGQLSMNLTDGLAARRLREIAPRTFEWLVEIRDGRHAVGNFEPGRRIAATSGLKHLVVVIGETFVPLMKANAEAFDRFRSAGERKFNEKAFDEGRSLYDGELAGYPFRSVAKSFQARSWCDLCARWQRLDPVAQSVVAGLLPAGIDDAFSAVPRK